MDADPIWPVLVLVVIQAGDAVACALPLPAIAAALDRIDCPVSIRRVLPVVKAASAAGLAIGLWVTAIGLATIAALVVYFVIAIAFHVRAHDTVRNTVAAAGMLVVCVVVGGVSFA